MSEKIVKYEYEYGLCKRMHYRGLWCVRYEGVPGHFEKAGMACSCAVDGCDKDCAVMESADAVIDPEWSGICWTIRLEDRKKLRQRQEELHIIP